MLIAIPDVLDASGVARLRGLIDAGAWSDGNATSGPQSALAKRNEQLPEDDAASREGGALATSSGLRLMAEPLDALEERPIDTLMTVGGAGTAAAMKDEVLIAWLARQAGRARRGLRGGGGDLEMVLAKAVAEDGEEPRIVLDDQDSHDPGSRCWGVFRIMRVLDVGMSA